MYITGIKQEIASTWECVPCQVLPPEADEWRRKAIRYLIKTLPARDITEDTIALILEADNYDFDQDATRHYCLPNCPLGCRTSRNPSAKGLEEYTHRVGLGLFFARLVEALE